MDDPERSRINAELKAERLREMEWESDEEYFILEFLEMQEFGCCSDDELLESLDGKKIWWPPPY
jgi:hypothetical protein